MLNIYNYKIQLQSEREDTSEWIYIRYCWKEFATRKHQFFPLVWNFLSVQQWFFPTKNPVVIGVAGTDIHISIQEPHFLCVESNPVSTITVQSLGTLPWSSRVFWKMQRWNWNELHIFLLCFQVLTYRHWWIGENYVIWNIWTGYTILVRSEICDHSFCLMFDLHLLNPGRPMHPEGYFRICWELWLQGMSSQFFFLEWGWEMWEFELRKTEDLVSLVLLLIDAIFLPLSIAWDWKMGFDTVSGSILSVSIYVSLVFWTVDIFLNLNTAVYIQGQLVTKRRAIFRRYLSTWFFLDVTIVILDYLNLAQDMQRGWKTAVISLKRSKTATLLRHSNIDLTRLIMNQASKAWKNETDRLQKSRLLARVYWKNDILIDLHRYRYS